MRKYFLFLFLIFTNVNPSFAESSKEILSKALNISNSINQNLTVEQKLSKYENIQNLIDKILDEHSGSDESIKIISGQQIGNFNYALIQDNYLRELTSYYDTVCGVSPSFECIAFVSLNQGVKSCKNSKTFKQLELSHKDIKNALNIFSSQDSKNNYKSLALNSYKNCLSNSKVKRTASIQDYFSSNLVPMFLSLDKNNEAKAIVQQLNDPYLKFAGVIEITKSENGGISKEFFDRMQEYIDNKMNYEDYGKKYGFAEEIKWRKIHDLASLRLKTEMLRNALFPIDEKLLQYRIDESLSGSYASYSLNDGKSYNDDTYVSTCSAKFDKNLFDAHINLLDISILKSREIMPDRLAGWHLFVMMNGNGWNWHGSYLHICAQSGDKKDYTKAVDVYSRIGTYDYSEGVKFLDFAAKSNYDSDQMMEYYLQFERRSPNFSKVLTKKQRERIYDKYFLFKKYVLNDQMCEAINILFKEFKGNENYSRAISYLINSPDVDRNKKYDCGDASLEMLLN